MNEQRDLGSVSEPGPIFGPGGFFAGATSLASFLGTATQSPAVIPSQFVSLYRKWGSASVDWRLLAAIGKVESSHNPFAVNPSDPSVGIMQTQGLIVWVFGLGGDRSASFNNQLMLNLVTGNADLGIKAGSGFLRELFQKHRFSFSENEIIQMYNLGETKVINGVPTLDSDSTFS